MEDLGVLITVDADQVATGINSATNKLNNFDKAAQKVGQSVDVSTSSMVKGFAAITAGLAAVKIAYDTLNSTVDFFVDGVKSSFAEIDSTSKLADSLGVGVDDFTRLSHAANLSGVSIDKLGLGLQNMNKRLVDVASTGSGKAKNALDTLGLSANELTKMAPDKAFIMISDAISEVESVAQQAQLAEKLGLKDLVNVVSIGSDGLKTLAGDADTLGITLDRVDGAKIEAANDAWSRMDSAIKGIFNSMSVALAPAVTMVLNYVTDLIVEFGGFSSIANAAIEFVVSAIGTAIDVLSVFYGSLQVVGGAAAQGFGILVEVVNTAMKAVVDTIITSIATVADRIPVYGQEMADALRSAGSGVNRYFETMINTGKSLQSVGSVASQAGQQNIASGMSGANQAAWEKSYAEGLAKMNKAAEQKAKDVADRNAKREDIQMIEKEEKKQVVREKAVTKAAEKATAGRAEKDVDALIVNSRAVLGGPGAAARKQEVVDPVANKLLEKLVSNTANMKQGVAA